MKRFTRIVSLLLLITLIAGLGVLMTACKPAETATYYITNDTNEILSYSLVKDVKLLKSFANVKPGDTIVLEVEITKKVNIFKIITASKPLGRIEMHPYDLVTGEPIYVDGGRYKVVTHETPGATIINYILVPDD